MNKDKNIKISKGIMQQIKESDKAKYEALTPEMLKNRLEDMMFGMKEETKKYNKDV